MGKGEKRTGTGGDKKEKEGKENELWVKTNLNGKSNINES